MATSQLKQQESKRGASSSNESSLHTWVDVGTLARNPTKLAGAASTGSRTFRQRISPPVSYPNPFRQVAYGYVHTVENLRLRVWLSNVVTNRKQTECVLTQPYWFLKYMTHNCAAVWTLVCLLCFHNKLITYKILRSCYPEKHLELHWKQ